MATSPNFQSLEALSTIVAHRSFRRAAAELGVSTSALSHSIRTLEAQLGVQLLSRTTRSVAPTSAGEQLLARVRPALDEVADAIAQVSLTNEALTGTLRINAPKLAVMTVLAEALPGFIARYPSIQLEISADNRLVDIVAERFDAGIRFGERLEQDMVATRVGADISMAVVGSPAYFKLKPEPTHPDHLREHDCIGFRFLGRGQRYSWEFDRDGKALEVEVAGPITTDDPEFAVRAALDGLGLVYTGLPYVAQHLEYGRLQRVLTSWCPEVHSFFLYYSNRRHVAPALKVFIQHLREK